MTVGHEARLSSCPASSALDGRNCLPLFELRQRHFTSANAEFVYFNAEVGPRQWPCFVWFIPKAQPAAFSSARHLFLVLRLEKLDSVNCTKADVFERLLPLRESWKQPEVSYLFFQVVPVVHRRNPSASPMNALANVILVFLCQVDVLFGPMMESPFVLRIQVLKKVQHKLCKPSKRRHVFAIVRLVFTWCLHTFPRPLLHPFWAGRLS